MFSTLYHLASSLGRAIHGSRSKDSIPERRKNAFSLVNGEGNLSAMTLPQARMELENADEKPWDVLIETLRSLANASDRMDVHTRGHSERVTRFSVEIAKIMGLTDDEIEQIRVGALVHDIGKIAIAREILVKPTLLSDAEYAVMKTHTTRGYELLEHIPQLRAATEAVRYHHERLDGKGYPYGLKGTEIPRLVRFIAVADCFDAMTTTRIYQDPAPVEQVIEMIRSAAGIKYDAQAVEALVQGVQAGRIVARSEDSTQSKPEVSRS
jgi:HD-GYP domain-containing protein (c-di-GMP phosphodiesterase class II)